MTTIYHYHPASAEHTASTQAQMSPLESDVPLIPAHATTQAPPQAGAHQAAVFDAAANKWQLVPDWRGVQLYSTADGSEVAAELWQAPADIAATDKPRPSEAHIWKAGKWALDAAKQAALIKQAQDAAWTLIKAERDRRVENGGYKVGEKWFHSDQHSRSQQIGMVLLGASLPANLQWKTMDGSFVTMTATLAKQILEAAAASDQAIFAKAEAHKTAMLASADPASYDHLSGWPAVFGDAL